MTVRQYNRPYQVLLLTCVVNCTAGTPTPRLCPVVQWLVHRAPSRTTRVPVLAGARRCALATCGKKRQTPLLGLAKSIHYFTSLGKKPRDEELVIICLSERGIGWGVLGLGCWWITWFSEETEGGSVQKINRVQKINYLSTANEWGRDWGDCTNLHYTNLE